MPRWRWYVLPGGSLAAQLPASERGECGLRGAPSRSYRYYYGQIMPASSPLSFQLIAGSGSRCMHAFFQPSFTPACSATRQVTCAPQKGVPVPVPNSSSTAVVRKLGNRNGETRSEVVFRIAGMHLQPPT